MFYNKPFTKDMLDYYLKELAKEFRKLNGKKMPAEIILIGGASILANYGFREMTYDMDAIISASSAMKEAINHVGDKFGLPNGWLNTDFVKTKSYTSKLIEYSEYYKTYSNILTIRTVASEYLVAMKLMSGRKYKNDLSDIVGILSEHKKLNNPLSREQIEKAACDLYDSWDNIPEHSKTFTDAVYDSGDYEFLFEQYQREEQLNKDVLLEFQEQYPNVANEDNIDEILTKAKQKRIFKGSNDENDEDISEKFTQQM